MTTQTQNARLSSAESPSASFLVIPESGGEMRIELDPDVVHPNVSLQDGDIYIAWESSEPPAILTFYLPEDLDDTVLDGFQVGFLDRELPPDTSITIPFQCRCDEARRELILTLEPPAWVLDQSSGLVYSLSLSCNHVPTAESYRHDPKIYNQGGGG